MGALCLTANRSVCCVSLCLFRDPELDQSPYRRYGVDLKLVYLVTCPEIRDGALRLFGRSGSRMNS